MMPDLSHVVLQTLRADGYDGLSDTEMAIVRANNRVFIAELHDGLAELQIEGRRVAIPEDQFVCVSGVSFDRGDNVVVSKGGSESEAKVADIVWHYRLDCPFYVLTLGNRKLSKRYFEQDLKPRHAPVS